MMKHHPLRNITKSSFIKSIFFQIISIFSIVVLLVILVVFFSFTSEMNKEIIHTKQKQLDSISETISKRMDEINSSAYKISTDKYFTAEPVEGALYSGYEMTNTLERYLVGNGFIDYLIYYRLSEPDTFYTSRGELNYRTFWDTFLNYEGYDKYIFLSLITGSTGVRIFPLMTNQNHHSYILCMCNTPVFEYTKSIHNHFNSLSGSKINPGISAE